MQAEVILAAALRELAAARVSIADCTAALATARRHLGLGGTRRRVFFYKKNTI